MWNNVETLAKVFRTCTPEVMWDETGIKNIQQQHRERTEEDDLSTIETLRKGSSYKEYNDQDH